MQSPSDIAVAMVRELMRLPSSDRQEFLQILVKQCGVADLQLLSDLLQKRSADMSLATLTSSASFFSTPGGHVRKIRRLSRDPAAILPMEVVWRIFVNLHSDVKNLVAIQLVSRRWRGLSNDNKLWQNMCLCRGYMPIWKTPNVEAFLKRRAAPSTLPSSRSSMPSLFAELSESHCLSIDWKAVFAHNYSTEMNWKKGYFAAAKFSLTRDRISPVRSSVSHLHRVTHHHQRERHHERRSHSLPSSSSMDVDDVETHSDSDTDEQIAPQMPIPLPPPMPTPPLAAQLCCLHVDASQMVTVELERSGKIWDLTTGLLLSEFEGHAGLITVAKMTESSTTCGGKSRRIISGSVDRTVKVWDLQDILPPGAASSANSSPGMRRRAVCKRTLEGHTGEISCLGLDIPLTDFSIVPTLNAFSPSSSGDDLRVPHVPSLSEPAGRSRSRCTAPSSSRVPPQTSSPTASGRIIVTGSEDQTVRVWDTEIGDCIRIWTGHEACISCVQMRSGWVVSGSWDSTLRVWNVEKDECVARLRGHAKDVYCAQFDGENIVSGSADHSIKVWDTQSYKCLRTITGHNASIVSLLFDSSKIVSGSSDGTVKVWDFRTGECWYSLSEQKTPVWNLFFDKTRLISSGFASLSMWDFSVPPPSLKKHDYSQKDCRCRKTPFCGRPMPASKKRF